MGAVFVVMLLLAGLAWFMSARDRKHEIDMELAKHGMTRESAKRGASPKRNTKKESKKDILKSSSSGSIHNITNPKGSEYKIYGAGNNMLCTVRAKGKLVGWGDDFFLMDNNGKITTYNCEGDSLGSVKYNPNKEYIGSIRKKGFTLVSSKNEKRKKRYDSSCAREYD